MQVRQCLAVTLAVLAQTHTSINDDAAAPLRTVSFAHGLRTHN